MAATVSDAFGVLLSAELIEAQAKASLIEWFPTYLREVERQLDVTTGMFPAPQNYSDSNTFDAEAGEQLPKVVVISPGIIGAPIQKGGGKYSAMWRLGIGIAIAADTEKIANTLVKGYGAAIRGIMLQNSGMASVNAVDIRWTDESYSDLPIPNMIKLVKAASLYFNIDVDDVVRRGRGPTTPDQQATDYDYGEVQTVITTITKV